MRIALATNQLDVGGIETNLVRLTDELVTQGHEVELLTAGGRLVDAVEASGGAHHEMRFSSPRALPGLRSMLAGVDVVHVFSATAALPTNAVVRTLRPRPGVVASIMGLRIAPEESSPRVWARALATVAGADAVVVVSPAIDRVVRRLPVAARKIVHGSVVGVRLPSDDPTRGRAEARRRLGIADDVPLVMTVGRLDPSKSHELFVRAAASIASAVPSARFLVIGEGARRAEIEHEIAVTGAPVTLVGERVDAPELVAAADVYVRPGVVEGFVGITVLEAQAWRVPVVSFETEDVRLAIEDGFSGVLAANGDVTALADAIRSLLMDPDRAASIGAAGERRVRADFELGAVVDRLVALYERVAR